MHKINYMQLSEMHCFGCHKTFVSMDEHSADDMSKETVTPCTPSCGKYYKQSMKPHFLKTQLEWLIKEIEKIPNTYPVYESDLFDKGMQHMKNTILQLLI